MLPTCIFYPVLCRKIEKESPERGRKRFTDYLPKFKKIIKIEKESPERGRKYLAVADYSKIHKRRLKKKAPRGDGNIFETVLSCPFSQRLKKKAPRGDGNYLLLRFLSCSSRGD